MVLAETEVEVASGVDWGLLGSQAAVVCNRWANRRDISVLIGPGRGGRSGIANWRMDLRRITVNATTVLGELEPDSVVDIRTREGLSKYPVLGGVLMHESGHARFSIAEWNQELRSRFSSAEWAVFELLEETRVEGRMVEAHPRDRGFVRASASALVLADREAWSGRYAAIAILGREEVGVLAWNDVHHVETWLLNQDGWTVEILDEVRTLIAQHEQVDDTRLMESLAKQLDEIMPPDPEVRSEDDALIGILSGAASSAERGGTADVIDALVAERAEEARAEQAAAAREQSRNENEAANTFGGGLNGQVGLVPSQLKNRRAPSVEERAAATRLARMLEKARYRDRTPEDVGSMIPPGRFNPGEAMRKAAAISVGARADRYEPFTDRRWHETEESPLSVGIMSDVSGSMRAMQPAVGSALWVISDAVNRLDKAKAAAVYFGDKVYPGLRVGERLDKVRTWEGGGAMEEFNRGFRALDGALSLIGGSGARLLVVSSDGNYKGMQNDARNRHLRNCVQNGVAVLWLSYRSEPNVESLPGLEVVIVDGKVHEVIDQIGSAAVRALERVSR